VKRATDQRKNHQDLSLGIENIRSTEVAQKEAAVLSLAVILKSLSRNFVEGQSSLCMSKGNNPLVRSNFTFLPWRVRAEIQVFDIIVGWNLLITVQLEKHCTSLGNRRNFIRFSCCDYPKHAVCHR